MADETTEKPVPIFPVAGLPVAFADAVRSFSHTDEVVKFYFSRVDPSVNAVGENQIAEVAQVVMPVAGFLGMAAIF